MMSPSPSERPNAAVVDAVMAKANEYRGAFAPGGSGECASTAHLKACKQLVLRSGRGAKMSEAIRG
jgi:hypothetical protein